jgi:hypothetical protein
MNNKNKNISLLTLCDEKYNIYLNTISYWSYNDNDYSYIREKIWKFVNIKNNYDTYEYKIKLMKYIDNEINTMNSLYLLNNMDIF